MLSGRSLLQRIRFPLVINRVDIIRRQSTINKMSEPITKPVEGQTPAAAAAAPAPATTGDDGQPRQKLLKN